MIPQELIDKHMILISGMSRCGIAELIRFAAAGHPYFRDDYPFYAYMMRRFRTHGGWSPTISKAIGWKKAPIPCPPDLVEFL